MKIKQKELETRTTEFNCKLIHQHATNPAKKKRSRKKRGKKTWPSPTLRQSRSMPQQQAHNWVLIHAIHAQPSKQRERRKMKERSPEAVPKSKSRTTGPGILLVPHGQLLRVGLFVVTSPSTVVKHASPFSRQPRSVSNFKSTQRVLCSSLAQQSRIGPMTPHGPKCSSPTIFVFLQAQLHIGLAPFVRGLWILQPVALFWLMLHVPC